jgi:hypothetical protein
VTFTATQSIRRDSLETQALCTLFFLLPLTSNSRCSPFFSTFAVGLREEHTRKVRYGEDTVAGTRETCPNSVFASAAELICLLEMFLRQLSHTEILKPASQHPMVKRIVGSRFVCLLFMRTGLLEFT